MKAVTLRGVGDMELIDMAEPEPGPGEIKLRVRYCGICGSDLHEFQSNVITLRINRQSPIMGHEFTGAVVGVGAGVEGFAVGDLATVNPGNPCGECLYCKSDRDNLCEQNLGLGYHRPGAFAEYVCAKASRAVKIAPDAPVDQVALLHGKHEFLLNLSGLLSLTVDHRPACEKRLQLKESGIYCPCKRIAL